MKQTQNHIDEKIADLFCVSGSSPTPLSVDATCIPGASSVFASSSSSENHSNEFLSSGSSPGAEARPSPAETLSIARKSTLPKILRQPVPKQPIRKSDPLYQLVVRKSTLPSVLHPDVGKTIYHRGQSVVVLSVHSVIRQVQSLENSYSFWIPRRPSDKKKFQKERMKRQYVSGIRKAFTYPCFMGEARPLAATVPVEQIYQELPPDTVKFLRYLGQPETRLLMFLSRETQMMSVLIRRANLKRFLNDLMRSKSKELLENLTIEVLRRSKMGDRKINAVYDVLVDGVGLEHVANTRGLDVRLLKRTVRRIGAEVRPQMEAQLEVWAAGQEEVVEAQQETEELIAAESILVNLPPEHVNQEQVMAMRSLR